MIQKNLSFTQAQNKTNCYILKTFVICLMLSWFEKMHVEFIVTMVLEWQKQNPVPFLWKVEDIFQEIGDGQDMS